MFKMDETDEAVYEVIVQKMERNMEKGGGGVLNTLPHSFFYSVNLSQQPFYK